MPGGPDRPGRRRLDCERLHGVPGAGPRSERLIDLWVMTVRSAPFDSELIRPGLWSEPPWELGRARA